MNGTVINTGTNAANDTNFTIAGDINLTASFAGNVNCSSSAVTWWAHVAGSSDSVATNETVSVGENVTEVIFPSNLNVTDFTVNTSTASTTVVIIDFASEANGNVTIQEDLNISRETTGQNYSIEFDAGTVIIGGSAWNGELIIPTVNSSSFSVSGGSVNVVLEMGSDTELNFSEPVKIVLGGMATKNAAWARGSSTLTNITTACNNGSNVPSNIFGNGTSPRECSIDSGSDLIIWTYHFTSFGAFTPTPATVTPSTGSSGGGCLLKWTCGEWSACADGNQTRTCTESGCGFKPKTETQSCTASAADSGSGTAATGGAQKVAEDLKQEVKKTVNDTWKMWMVGVIVLLAVLIGYMAFSKKK
jgi:hypothetical protein